MILLITILFAASVKPIVWKKNCVGCQDCVNYCPVNAVTMVQGKAVINAETCIDCKICVTACGYNAIK